MEDKLDFSYCAGTKGPPASNEKANGGAGQKGAGDVRSARGWKWQRGDAPSSGASSGSQGAVGDRATIIVFIMGCA